MCVLDHLDTASRALANLHRAAVEEGDTLAAAQAREALRALGHDELGVMAYLIG
jgi:hypothetical protein